MTRRTLLSTLLLLLSFDLPNRLTGSPASVPSGVYAYAVPVPSLDNTKHSLIESDVEILNYALGIEHLEAAFFQDGLQKYSKESFKYQGYEDWVYDRFKQIEKHEQTHVKFLTRAIVAAGREPSQKCKYKFAHIDPKSFVEMSVLIESVVTSAVNGMLPFVTDKAYLTAFGSILGVEARHTSWINSALLWVNPWNTAFETPLDANQAFSWLSSFVESCPDSPSFYPGASPPIPVPDHSSHSSSGAFLSNNTGSRSGYHESSSSTDSSPGTSGGRMQGHTHGQGADPPSRSPFYTPRPLPRFIVSPHARPGQYARFELQPDITPSLYIGALAAAELKSRAEEKEDGGGGKAHEGRKYKDDGERKADYAPSAALSSSLQQQQQRHPHVQIQIYMHCITGAGVFTSLADMDAKRVYMPKGMKGVVYCLLGKDPIKVTDVTTIAGPAVILCPFEADGRMHKYT